MTRDSAIDILCELLLGGADFEIVGSDRDTGVGYRATVRRGEIDIAPFSNIDAAVLLSSVESGLPLSIGATLYRIERAFVPTFLRAVGQASRVSAISVTLQSHHLIVCFLGDDPFKLGEAVGRHVPPTLEWGRDTLVEGSREWGRKVGHAAKDLAGLREATFGLEHLATLERSGEAEAYEAVCKEAVLPAPSIEGLRANGSTPAVAFGIVSCWRMLKQRPNRNPAFRLSYVRDLPPFFADLERCRTLDAFADVVGSYVRNMDDHAAAVLGTRLPNFALRITSGSRKYYSGSDSVIRAMLSIDALPDADAQWASAHAALSVHSRVREVAGSPLPTRPAVPLEQLTRSGLRMPEPPTIDRIQAELGITGLELGNYVSRREGERLAALVAEAFADLRDLLGGWVVPLCRRGNLSVALGARGKGKGCAHYEPALRVINLTKSRGDGSLAHEFAHFLDHMLAEHGPNGESRYLSGRVSRLPPNDHPVALAMNRVMQSLSVTPCRERVTGEVKPGRWFLRGWITARGYNPTLPPQESFDRVADRVPGRFRGGRDPRANSITLINSLAKFGESPVEVDIAFDGKSEFARHASRLGTYWSRPEELFARAFESFVEDEIARREWRSEYLVHGTRRDYSDCRGMPYPTDALRGRICDALCDLMATCAREQGSGKPVA